MHAPFSGYFAVPRNLKLLAVPLFELYDNAQRYGTPGTAPPFDATHLSLLCRPCDCVDPNTIIALLFQRYLN